MLFQTFFNSQRYEYGYDANSNRTYAKIKQAGHDNDRSYIYKYDHLDRLVDAGFGMVTVNAADEPSFVAGIASETTKWKLDLLGNWSDDSSEEYAVRTFSDANGDFVYDAGEDTSLKAQTHTTDKKNRITSVDTDGAVSNFHHDDAGNLVFDGEQYYVYDAWNRLVEVKQAGTLVADGLGGLTGTPGGTIAKYAFDAVGRMVNKQVSNSGALDTAGAGDFFYYDGHRAIEHHREDADGVLSLHRQYIYGLDDIDEVVAFNDEVGARHFVVQDANNNVVGVASALGDWEQQYGYKPYGERLFVEDATGTTIDFQNNPDQVLISKGHQGLEHMPEIDAIYNRDRILKPKLGRFLQEDPNDTSLVLVSVLMRNAETALFSALASVGGQYGDGLSLYQYAGSNPVNRRDPSGLFSETPYEGDDAWELAQQIPGDWFTGFAWATQLLNRGLDVTKGFAMFALAFTPAGIAIELMDAFATMQKSPGDWDIWDMIAVGGTALTAAIPLAKLAKSAFRYVGKGIKARKGRQLAKLAGPAIGCISSFVPGTLVLMGDESLRPIEEIVPGDYVMAVNEETGTVHPQPVSDTVTRIASDVLSIEVGGQIIKTTARHPFWVIGRGWVEAGLLETGDRLILHENEVVPIASMWSESATGRVHNLDVWEDHSYFVASTISAQLVLVHNCTKAQIRDLANWFKFKKAGAHPNLGRRSHGEQWFTDKKKRWYTFDNTGDKHKGGVWKVFDRAGERLGTMDIDGNIIGK